MLSRSFTISANSMDMARRSSRASRAGQPQSTSRHSSAGSTSSGRADKSTRSHNKIGSPEKPNPTGSLASELPEEVVPTVEEPSMQTRRKRGRVDGIRERPLRNLISQAHSSNLAEELGEDDEAVRCICGLDDYPGPPQLEDDMKSGGREAIEDQLITATEVTEDLAGFFLQCDVCKVWQHGGCVGIMNEGTSPDEYFCERCRKDLHKIFTSAQGQRYSHYLPIYQSLSRISSRAASISKDRTRSPRETKSGRPCPNNQNANAKKRSTMNSRDAAYDEEEQLRQAIKASKDEKNGESVDGGTRRGKRSQSDTDEKADFPKRQRTQSATPSSCEAQIVNKLDFEQSSAVRILAGKKHKFVGSKNPKEKEIKDDREKMKFGVAGNRSRAERKRDMDLLEFQSETFLENIGSEINNSCNTQAFTTCPFINAPSTITPLFINSPDSVPLQLAHTDTPPINSTPTYPKRGGRPPNSRKGKAGKNQYTRDRDLQDQNEQTPYRSQSRDTSKNDDNMYFSINKGLTNEGRTARLKGNNSKVTITDMNKRVTAILNFISRTQLEMANESPPQVPDSTITPFIQGLTASLPPMYPIENTNHDQKFSWGHNKGITNDAKDFKDLSCRDMMDILTKKLIKWQKEFL